MRSFGRFIRWQVESRIYNEVIVSWIDGTALAVHRGMTGATGNIYCGLHEFEDMAFLLHFLRPDDVFVDVGANVGSYTVLASGVCGAQTIAFEPDPKSFAALMRNVELNKIDGLVQCRECATGAEVGKIDFTVGLDTMNKVALDKNGPTAVVAIDTLDHGLDGKCPNLIKLDVEGFEGEVLKGASQTLNRAGLKAIITEDSSPAVINVLRAAGFSVHSYDPLTRKLTAGRPRGPAPNSLFVRDSDYVQHRLINAARIHVLGRSL